MRGKPKRNIQSIEVGFKLIRALEEAPGPTSLKLLSKRAGMEPSKAHLYLVSFCNLGLVTRKTPAITRSAPMRCSLASPR